MKSLLKNRIFFYALIVVFSIGLILIFKGVAGGGGKNYAFFAVKPVASFFAKTGYWLQDRVEFFSSIGSLKRDNNNLYEENVVLKAQIAELKDVASENQALRQQMDIEPREKFELESALIFGRDINQSKEIAYINKGNKDGLQEGMPVIVGGGILIGKVSKVFDFTSEIELILAQTIKINAEVQEVDARGIIHGEYGTSVVMDMIPQTVEINIGDSVITSGLGNEVPRGLLVGYVKDIISTPDRLFQKASLGLPVSIEGVRVVSIIKAIK